MPAEHDDHYERIQRMWRDAGLWGRKVQQTPNWQEGYLVLCDWFREKINWEPYDGPMPPYVKADHTWHYEVHAFSHTANRGRSHGVDHAMLEEEAARVVIDWWNKQR
jgi:hypothetical protein